MTSRRKETLKSQKRFTRDYAAYNSAYFDRGILRDSHTNQLDAFPIHGGEEQEVGRTQKLGQTIELISEGKKLAQENARFLLENARKKPILQFHLFK